MLDCVIDPADNSRRSCRIKVTDALVPRVRHVGVTRAKEPSGYPERFKSSNAHDAPRVAAGCNERWDLACATTCRMQSTIVTRIGEDSERRGQTEILE